MSRAIFGHWSFSPRSSSPSASSATGRRWIDSRTRHFADDEVGRGADEEAGIRAGGEGELHAAEFHAADLLGDDAEEVAGLERAHRAAFDGDAGDARDHAVRAGVDEDVVAVAEEIQRAGRVREGQQPGGDA